METDLLGERSRKYTLSNINEKLSLTFFSSTCVIYLTFKQIFIFAGGGGGRGEG